MRRLMILSVLVNYNMTRLLLNQQVYILISITINMINKINSEVLKNGNRQRY